MISLTKPQHDFIKLTNTNPFNLFLAGYSAGKSEAIIVAGILDLVSNPGINIAYYSPTQDLNKINLIPRIEQKLKDLGIPYTVNKSDYIISTQYGKLYFRSMENPARIIAYEVGRSYVDELDTLPKHKALIAWQKIIARNRQVLPDLLNTVNVATTPEGFNLTYDLWKEDTAYYKKIQAPTSSNPFISADYINNLKETYPPNLIKAYLEGKWVNIQADTVYSYFDRNKHHSPITDGDIIYIGQDFNINGCVSIVLTKHNDTLIAINEIVSKDTREVAESIKHYNPIVFPDASARALHTSSGYSDLDVLKTYNIRIKAPKANPPIQDRVNATNLLFFNNKLLINTERCPRLTQALEQQPYDLNTGKPMKENKHPSNDDFTDALSYACVNLKKPRSKTINVNY